MQVEINDKIYGLLSIRESSQINERLAELLQAEAFLEMLDSYGVDNWEGYCTDDDEYIAFQTEIDIILDEISQSPMD